MYQHDFIDNFDLGLFGPDDAGVTSSVSLLQQHGEGCISQYARQPQHRLSLAERMQGDKMDTLYSMTASSGVVGKFDIDYESLAASSNLHEMMELGELEEVKPEPEEMKDENDHQALIDEVERFLHQHESVQEAAPDQPMFEECPMSSTVISDDDKLAAESLIDKLFCDSIAIDLDGDQQQSLLASFDETLTDFVPYDDDDDIDVANDDTRDDSGFVDNSGKLTTSELVMPDGTKVIFVIAPPSPTSDSSQIGVSSPASTDFAASPESPESVASSPAESDFWSPVSGRGRRKPYERKSGGVKKARLTVVDKKERKKIQNVEAARRYRDKKKSEQQLIDEELEELAKKNADLKSKVSEKESELRTLKKLMAELGLIKIASQK